MDLEARKKRQRGWALVSVLFMTAGLIGFVRTRPLDPQDMIEGLLAQVEASEPRTLMHRHEAAFVAFLPNHGYHLTVYVEQHERFAPAKYLTINNVDGDLSLELMADVGEENVFVLRGEERLAYLERAQLDTSPVEELFRRRFTSEGLARQQQGR
jgi:hypothetical protein